MAGDWLKFEKATLDKPEVFAIAAITGLDPDAVLGKLLRVWSWFDTHTESGNAPRVTSLLLDRIAGVSGFTDAMAKVGWLTVTEDGVQQPGFDKHTGQSAKTRAETARRVAKSRAGVAPLSASGNGKSVTSPLAREEKRREEEKQSPIVHPAAPAAPEPVPDSLPAIAPPADPAAKADAKTRQTAERFAEFWAVYPVKKGRMDALKKWKAKRLDSMADQIVAHVRMMEREDEQWRNGFIPHGSTYINGELWNDEPKRSTDPRSVTAPAPQQIGAQAALARTESKLENTIGFIQQQYQLGEITQQQMHEQIAEAKRKHRETGGNG